jgi:hypothetical protein
MDMALATIRSVESHFMATSRAFEYPHCALKFIPNIILAITRLDICNQTGFPPQSLGKIQRTHNHKAPSPHIATKWSISAASALPGRKKGAYSSA